LSKNSPLYGICALNRDDHLRGASPSHVSNYVVGILAKSGRGAVVLHRRGRKFERIAQKLNVTVLDALRGNGSYRAARLRLIGTERLAMVLIGPAGTLTLRKASRISALSQALSAGSM